MPNEKEEIFDIELFLKLYKKYEGFTLQKDESPDFILTKGNLIIGVEHTKLFKKSGKNTLQAEESNENYITSIAQKCYQNRNNPPVDIDVLYNLKNLRGKPNWQELGEELSNIISREITSIKEPLVPHRVDSAFLPEYLYSLNIMLVPAWNYCHWDCSGAGWVMSNAKDVIKQTLKNKNIKIKNYRRNFDRLILLVVFGHNPSNYIHPNKETLEYIYESDFDSVFLLDRALFKLHQLELIDK